MLISDAHIRFKYGEEIIAGARHEWLGQITRGYRKNVRITTEELFNMPRENESYLRFRIKVAEKIKQSIRI